MAKGTRKLVSGYSPVRFEGKRSFRLARREDFVAGWMHSAQFLDIDGNVRDCRQSGKVKTWKRSPERFSVPFKYGMYESFRTDEDRQDGWNAGAILIPV